MENDKVESTLNSARTTWQKKPVLRAIYHDYYRRMVDECVPGQTLEIGGGSGNLKEFLPNVISTDIQAVPWLDVAADAQALPFPNSTFDNIVMLDVLHHIERPARFFREASRTLRPGGRIIMVEPMITPVSWIFYNFFHPEPVDMGVDPLVEGDLSPDRDPFDANQAFPTNIFIGNRSNFEGKFPDLRIASIQLLSIFAYPLSGGFRPWSLLPATLVSAVLKIENFLLPLLGRIMAFRIIVCIERK